MRIFTFRHLFCLLLCSGIIDHPGLDTSARASTEAASEIVATVNGEFLYASEVIPSQLTVAFLYYIDHPPQTNLEQYRKYTKRVKVSFLIKKIKQVIRRQWIEEQGIAVSKQELDTAWQNSRASKRLNLKQWKKEKNFSKVLFKSFKEALDPQHFPKKIYQASQIEKYKKYLKSVHQKYHERLQKSDISSFSDWVTALWGWTSSGPQRWEIEENITSSFEKSVASEKQQFRSRIIKLKTRIRALEIKAETDPHVKRCLDKHPPKGLETYETYSKERRICLGRKAINHLNFIYQKADIQIHDPELKPALDFFRKSR